MCGFYMELNLMHIRTWDGAKSTFIWEVAPTFFNFKVFSAVLSTDNVKKWQKVKKKRADWKKKN